MAINYSKIGWNTTKFVNPTNMNHMDDGIKAACDAVDAMAPITSLFKIEANSSINGGVAEEFSLPVSFNGLMLVQNQSDTQTSHGLYSVLTTITGVVYVAPINARTALTIEKGTRKITVTNTGTAAIQVIILGVKA